MNGDATAPTDRSGTVTATAITAAPAKKRTFAGTALLEADRAGEAGMAWSPNASGASAEEEAAQSDDVLYAIERQKCDCTESPCKIPYELLTQTSPG
jgi:hypothetical protein